MVGTRDMIRAAVRRWTRCESREIRKLKNGKARKRNDSMCFSFVFFSCRPFRLERTGVAIFPHMSCKEQQRKVSDLFKANLNPVLGPLDQVRPNTDPFGIVDAFHAILFQGQVDLELRADGVLQLGGLLALLASRHGRHEAAGDGRSDAAAVGGRCRRFRHRGRLRHFQTGNCNKPCRKRKS